LRRLQRGFHSSEAQSLPRRLGVKMTNPLKNKKSIFPKRENLFKGRTDLSLSSCATKLSPLGLRKVFPSNFTICAQRFCLQILWPVIWPEFKTLSLHLLELQSVALVAVTHKQPYCGHTHTHSNIFFVPAPKENV
jgi:hypothetical protein